MPPSKGHIASASLIDDIFASSSSKPRPSGLLSTTSLNTKGKSRASGSPPTHQPAKKKKKALKTVAASIPSPPPVSASRTMVRPVDTVLDPSSVPPAPATADKPAKEAKKGTKRDRKGAMDDELFRDSRGDGPSERTSVANATARSLVQDGRRRRDS